MNENRRQILEMLAAGKINADEAERLLTVVETGADSSQSVAEVPHKGKAKYLRVLVEAYKNGSPATVNVRVPMQLLRAGVRLASLIPVQAHAQLDEALSKHGVPLTVSQIKPENLEELIDHLEEFTVDVNAQENGEKATVRVFCE
jgi:polyhydroxyalkanoate synthesis regulator phasin